MYLVLFRKTARLILVKNHKSVVLSITHVGLTVSVMHHLHCVVQKVLRKTDVTGSLG